MNRIWSGSLLKTVANRLVSRAARKTRLCSQRLADPRPGITLNGAGLRFFLFLVITGIPAGAHNGPPFPIIEGRRIGPFVVALWTHPDVGIGTFFVILDAPPGGRISNDLKVDIGVQPVSGRLPEVRYAARRE